ncbi:hypothetical protein FLONG3_472 [Fusarium longipes]|uniref:F-box domain-containing protein n=1 Tax=Fusarium longipes TaxID=694270 RepID=A0A395T9F7_9HYPO|nr:hypothetical protein FLONG3_472 [Fusarium longipes]
MMIFDLDPEVSTWLPTRLADYWRLRRGTYHIPVLEPDERVVSPLDTSRPEDTDLPVPFESPRRTRQKNLECRLLQLPPELVLEIMSALPDHALYMLRQTCQTLRNLTDDFQFEGFRLDILEHEKYLFGMLQYDLLDTCYQLRDIKWILLRRSLCGPCGKIADSGELS